MQFAARTDFLRLVAGELVYMGLLRTRLDAILPAALLGGRTVQLAPELLPSWLTHASLWAKSKRTNVCRCNYIL